jgi:hypothetical protein
MPRVAPAVSLNQTTKAALDQLVRSPSTPQGLVQTTLHLGHQLLGNVQRKTTSFYATVQDVTGMLLAARASPAVLAHTRATPEVERTKKSRPEVGRLILEPA